MKILQTGGALDASGAAEPDRHFSFVDDDGNLTAAAGVFEHFVERSARDLDILVVHGDVFRCVVLTGRNRVGSGVFSENQNCVGHDRTPCPDGVSANEPDSTPAVSCGNVVPKTSLSQGEFGWQANIWQQQNTPEVV